MQPMLEDMRDFFTARLEEYDRHMLNEVDGCREGYRRMAGLLPEGISHLLDIGCGTGLELEPIFERFGDLWVTGLDMTPAMLDRLREKYPGKWLTLIPCDYRTFPLEKGFYDAAVSFQTLHHLTHREKLDFYTRLHASLKPGGVYVEGDYMVTDPAQEAFYFAQAEQLRAQQGLPPNAPVHYDTPCTVQHQIELLLQAGFSRVEMVWREGNTTLLIAHQ